MIPMLRKSIALSFFAAILSFASFAQGGYSVIQAGANAGFANSGYAGTFSGFAAHFIFGKNYDDRAYLGLGIGNEIFKGDYRPTGNDMADTKTMKYDYSLLPIFIDGRLPIANFGYRSNIGALANAGYAPALCARYDRGFLFKAGFYYLLETSGSANIMLSTAYGYQQLNKNFYQKNFQHQHLAIAVGVMFK